MKALLYKEFKLAMHPLIYVFIGIFPFMVLIPSYPLAISFIYLLVTYPILFLGANKGEQTNDLLFSTLMPVRKKDIVLARIITLITMQLVFILLMSMLYPLAIYINQIINSNPSSEEVLIPSLGLNSFVLILAFAIFGLSIADLIFLVIYYKNGKSIVLSSLLTMFAFIIYLALFTIVLPYIPPFKGINSLDIGYQFLALFIAIILSFLIHFLAYKEASKRLLKVDF